MSILNVLFLRRLVYTVTLLCLPVFYVSATIISQQPQDVAHCKKAGAGTFTVDLIPGYDELNVKVQWYKYENGVSKKVNGVNLSYSTDVSGEYYCTLIYKNSFNVQVTETTQHATLTLWTAPTITSVTVPAICNMTELRAEAVIGSNGGQPITAYYWVLNGVRYPSTGPQLSIPNVSNSLNNQLLKLIVYNSCDSSTFTTPITVHPIPSSPTFHDPNYCQWDITAPLTIDEYGTKPLWYTQPTGGTATTAPTPDTSIPGTQTWWVSHIVDMDDNTTCESNRTQADVTVTERSVQPATATNREFCLNDAPETLSATGTNIKWYDKDMKPLANAPGINTTVVGQQVYYVTQTELSKCESEKLKITINVKGRADQQLITTNPLPEYLCPYNSINIQASYPQAGAVFKWYASDNLTLPPIYTGSNFQTPVLISSMTYYVAVEYPGACQSYYPQAVLVNVQDNERPSVSAPQNLELPTDPGVCYATNVDLGTPVVLDNCTPIAELIVTDNRPNPAYYPLGGTQIEWVAKDKVGNTSDPAAATQTVTILDKEYPVATCPGDIEVVVDYDVNSAVINYVVSFSDNCNIDSVWLDAGLESGKAFPVGETIVRHLAVDDAGNITKCEFKVTVNHPWRELDVALKTSAYEICPGEMVTLTAVASGGTGKYFYTWEPRAWTEQSLEDYPTGTTQYKVNVFDGSATVSKELQVAVLPAQPVKLVYDGRNINDILEGSEVVINATPGFANYKFLINNQVMSEVGLNNQLTFMAELGHYAIRVFATDENYCVSQDQLVVDVESRRLPNVFTPNRDGKNEIFLEGYDLQVFNRSGELIFKGTDGWDGTYKGKVLPPGTYLYVVRRTMNNGEFRVYKGTVTLKL